MYRSFHKRIKCLYMYICSSCVHKFLSNFKTLILSYYLVIVQELVNFGCQDVDLIQLSHRPEQQSQFNLYFSHVHLFLIKRPGEIFQIEMFNPNFKKKPSHTTWKLNLLYELNRHISRILCLKSMYVVWLFYMFGLNILIWEFSPGIFMIHVWSIQKGLYFWKDFITLEMHLFFSWHVWCTSTCS